MIQHDEIYRMIRPDLWTIPAGPTPSVRQGRPRPDALDPQDTLADANLYLVMTDRVKCRSENRSRWPTGWTRDRGSRQ